MTVELGRLTLSLLTHLEVREAIHIVRHRVPGMRGDLIEALGRPSVEVSLRGIFYGLEALAELDELRRACDEQRPVDFFTEAAGEGYFNQVIISRLKVTQKAGLVDQFDFSCDLVEYVEPPEPALAELSEALDTELQDEATTFVDRIQDALSPITLIPVEVPTPPTVELPTAPALDLPSSLPGGLPSSLLGS